MALQQTENRVSIEVRQAQFAVEQNRASVESARAAMDYARQSLDAEQKKYQFGTSTTTAVLQTRSALATAESTLMSAMAAYEKSRVELERAHSARCWTTTASASTMLPGARSRICQCSLRCAAQGSIEPAALSPNATIALRSGSFDAAVFKAAAFFFPHNSLQYQPVSVKLLPLR